MKKKPLVLIISFLFFYSISAQEYSFGLKGGLNFNSIGELYHIGTANGGGVGVTPVEDTYYTTDKKEGFHYGAFLIADFSKLFIRTEINFVSLKNRYPLSKKKSFWTTERIDIPVLLGLKIFKPISLYVGPVFSNTSTMVLEGVEYPIEFKKSALNLNVGILIDLGRFGFDLRYEYSPKTIDSQRIDMFRSFYGTNVAYLLEYNPSQIIISLHVNIFKINGNERSNSIKRGWRGNGSCLN